MATIVSDVTTTGADGSTTEVITYSDGSRSVQYTAGPGTPAANQTTIQANITTHIAQMEAWLTANPNGAVLTAAQTKFLAQMLIGTARLLLGLTSTVGGAT